MISDWIALYYKTKTTPVKEKPCRKDSGSFKPPKGKGEDGRPLRFPDV